MIYTENEKIIVETEISSEDFQSLCFVKHRMDANEFCFDGGYELTENERLFLTRILEKFIQTCLKKAGENETTEMIFNGCVDNAGLLPNESIRCGGVNIPVTL